MRFMASTLRDEQNFHVLELIPYRIVMTAYGADCIENSRLLKISDFPGRQGEIDIDLLGEKEIPVFLTLDVSSLHRFYPL